MGVVAMKRTRMADGFRTAASLLLALTAVVVAVVGQLHLNTLLDMSRHEAEVSGRTYRAAVVCLALLSNIVVASPPGFRRRRGIVAFSAFVVLAAFMMNALNILVFERW